MSASPLPVILNVGGFQFDADDPRHDREANIRFMVEVRCEACGHSMLFDSEKFHGSNEPTLTNLTPEDEHRLEGEGGS